MLNKKKDVLELESKQMFFHDKMSFLELAYNLGIFYILIMLPMGSGTTNLRILASILILISSLFLVIIKKSLVKIKVDLIFSIFILYASTSILWSANFTESLILFIRFLSILLFSLYFTSNFNIEQIMNFFKIFFIAITILSFFGTLILPDLFVHQDLIHSGAWRGLLGHKNAFGAFSILVLILLLTHKYRFRYKKIHLVLILTTLVNIWRSESVTAYILTVTIIFLFIAYKILIFYKNKNLILFSSIVSMSTILIVLFFFIIYRNFEFILALVDRDINLTGRTNIWYFVRLYISRRPLFGYGYGGFWASDFAIELIANIGFTITSAHSGTYDLLLDLGYVGFILIFIHLILSIIIAIQKSFKKETSSFVEFSLLFLFFLFIINITDSRFLNTMALYFTIYSIVAIKLRSRS